MENKNELKKRKAKDAFIQVSESFFEKEEIMDIMSHFGFQGIGIYLKISLMLLKNQGKMKYDWKYISTKISEKKIIQEIITESGLFTLDNDKTYFSSYIVDEQLKERGKISLDQIKRVNKRWEKNKENTTRQTIANTKAIDFESGSKQKFEILTADEIEELDRKDGIKSNPRKQKVWEEDLELDS